MASGLYEPLASFTLEPGDILIKQFYAKDVVSHVIQAGQAVAQGSRNANYVHAAIAVDEDYIVESQGEGVVKNKLRDNLKHGYKYKVFRFDDEGQAQRAAEWAEQQLQRKPAYSIGKAFKSLFKRSGPKAEDEVGLLGEKTLFCSELTTECYNRTAYEHGAAAPIAIEPDGANPSKLIGYLKGSPAWTEVGTLP